MNNASVGWKATAGSTNEKELIALFLSALKEEINELKKGKGGKQFDVYNGRRVYSTRDVTVYRFLTEVSLRDDTPVTISIDGKPIAGQVVSTDHEGINIGLEADRGEFVPQATIHSSSHRIYEDLLSKLDRVRSGELTLNTDGTMKLFGFQRPGSLSNPVKPSELSIEGYVPNTEQKIAILKSLAQEVTFIWGPPGTGKTKTLSIILNQLIKAGQSVLLTSHTNAAVDEILKKFVENNENTPYIEAGKIVRYGIPTIVEDRFKELLVDTIVERQTSREKARIEELQTWIDHNLEKIQEYMDLEQAALVSNASLRKRNSELERARKDYTNLRQKIAALDSEYAQTTAYLINQRELLEKAKNANALRRLLQGLNIKRIEAEMETMETKQDILTLKLESLKSESKELEEKRSKLLVEIAQLKEQLEKTVTIDGIASLKSLQERIHELSQEVEDKRPQISKIQTKIEKLKENVLNNALAVGCTITRACLDSKIIKRKFDVLIIDEASMAALPSIFLLSGLSSGHYIVSGDFRQLPPISACDSESATMWLKRDIFVQSGIVGSVGFNVEDERLAMLKEQYRMHPKICALISDAVYGGKLRTAEKTKLAKEKISALPPFEGEELVFVDTAGIDPWIERVGNSSRLSPYSAAVCARLASVLAKEGKKKGVEINVGVVTPYSAQAHLISKILEDENVDRAQVLASTVHRFQGNEKECVIFDLVEGHPCAPGMLTKGSFADSEPGRLITVAISRAEGRFILVGNSRYIRSRFNKDDAILQVMDRIEKSGQVVESQSILPLFGPGTLLTQAENFNRELSECNLSVWNEKNFYEAFRHDLENAASSVVIFSPFIARKRLNTLVDDFRSCIEKGTKVYVITRHPDPKSGYEAETRDLIGQMREIGVKVLIASEEIGINERFHDKIAVVDNVVLYHGSMNILSQSDSSESMIAFRARRTVEELTKTFNINRIIRKYRNITGEHPCAIPLIKIVEKKLMKKMDPGSCPECNERLVLVKGNQSFYFGCPRMLDKGCKTKKEVDKVAVKKTVLELNIKCKKCSQGHMIFREGKRGPFIACDQYYNSHCQSTLDFDDDLED